MSDNLAFGLDTLCTSVTTGCFLGSFSLDFSGSVFSVDDTSCDVLGAETIGGADTTGVLDVLSRCRDLGAVAAAVLGMEARFSCVFSFVGETLRVDLVGMLYGREPQ
jgi:hypothetical protein